MAAEHSTQDMSRPGECVDLYYYDGETNQKQCFPTTQNTKFVSAFQSLTGGSQVLTLPPQNGYQDIVVEMALPGLVGAAGDLANLALNRAWGYQLIDRVSFRYGGSTQYFISGQQVFQNAIRCQPSQSAADAIATLGGNAAIGTDLSGVSAVANVVLTLPHNWPSGVGKAHPFPSDLLTQQIQVTLELKPVATIFNVAAAAGAGAIAAIPNALQSAQFVTQQVMLNNQGDALARRVDMATNVYAFPCEFTQNLVTLPLPSNGINSQVVLTGFRAGEVKGLMCWVSDTADVGASPKTAGYLNNGLQWYLPSSVQMLYAGDVYARYDNSSSPLWNLINERKQPAWSNTYLDNTLADTGPLSTYFYLPFAQTHVDEDSHYTLVHGKPITNGIVNLVINMPEARSTWQLNVSYIYNTTLLMSQGTADFSF